jgi:hypothetical protein
MEARFQLMFPARLILCVILLFGSRAGLVHGKEPKPSAAKAADGAQLFAWFDQLGIEDFSHAKLVRVQISSAQNLTTNKTIVDEPRGFLLWQKEDQFRVLLSDLTVATFEAEGKDPSKRDYVGWRSVSMEEEATALMRIFEQKRQEEYWADNHDTYTDRLDLRTQAFVLARYCATQGREDLAKRLLQTVSHAFNDLHGAQLQEELADGIGDTLRWRASLALADPQQNRQALAGLFRKISKNCRNRLDSKWIEQVAIDLEQMAVEDDTHRKISDTEFEHLSPAEQARELVFQLRDENTNEEDGWRRPWPFEPTKGNGSLKKLIALGQPAAPALIEALKDERLTRSVLRSTRYGGGAWVSTIQDLALDGLNEIAGVNFLWLVPDTGSMPIAEHRKRAAVLGEDWLKTAQEQGDLAWLRARVTTGAQGAQYCLQAIAKRHPEALADLALSTIPNMTDARARAEMLELLRKNNTPEVNQLLLDEVATGPTVQNRVAAAFILRERHQPEALTAMLGEFAALPKAAFKDEWAGSVDVHLAGMNEPDSPALLLSFLISSDSILAAAQIREILPQCGKDTRARIVQTYGYRLPAAGDPNIEPAGRELRRVVESLLISELDDNAVLENSNYNGFSAPSVAELAAWMLALNWPDKYHFDWETSAEVHAAQLAKIRAQTRSDKPAPPKR